LIQIRELADEDRDWTRDFLREHWAGPLIVTRGRLHHADRLPGFVALVDGVRQGLLTYHIDGDQGEIVSLDALIQGQGIGTALIDAVRRAAAAAGCRRLWVITTNDNTPAMRFYQRCGFAMAAVHRRAVAEVSRRLKPRIPALGLDGIPIRDEVEIEIDLTRDGP